MLELCKLGKFLLLADVPAGLEKSFRHLPCKSWLQETQPEEIRQNIQTPNTKKKVITQVSEQTQIVLSTHEVQSRETKMHNYVTLILYHSVNI